MATTIEILYNDLVSAVDDILKLEEHEGSCTNAAQKAIQLKIPPCKKCAWALEKRVERVKRAAESLATFKDVFTSV